MVKDILPDGGPGFLDTHMTEKQYSPEYQAAKGYTNEAVFIDWCQGLPSVLDTCYFYNRSAVADLGAILQQSERERARYTESQAEQLLTHLIYQELVKVGRENEKVHAKGIAGIYPLETGPGFNHG